MQKQRFPFHLMIFMIAYFIFVASAKKEQQAQGQKQLVRSPFQGLG